MLEQERYNLIESLWGTTPECIHWLANIGDRHWVRSVYWAKSNCKNKLDTHIYKKLTLGFWVVSLLCCSILTFSSNVRL